MHGSARNHRVFLPELGKTGGGVKPTIAATVPPLRETDPQSARSAHGGETDGVRSVGLAGTATRWRLAMLRCKENDRFLCSCRPGSIRLPNRQETRCNHQRKVAPCQP